MPQALVPAPNFAEAASHIFAPSPWPPGAQCLYGQYRAPFLVQPYLLQASQEDTFQIEININAGGAMLPPSTAADFAFAAQFQAEMKSVIAGLPTAVQKDSGIFSPACFHHCVTDAEGFWGLLIDGKSFKDVFTAWFEQGQAPQHVVDACSCAPTLPLTLRAIYPVHSALGHL